MAATLQLTAYEVADSVNIQENTSRLYVCLQITTTAGTYNHSGDTTGSITVNGQSFSLDGKKVDYNTTTILYEQIHTIAHTADGSKSVTVVAVFNPNTPATSQLSVSETVALTAIARASTIAATDADIGAVSMVAINRRSEEYTHSVFWQTGDLSGWMGADGSLADKEEKFTQTTIAFLVPERFYEQIPDSPTGVCTLTCTTYRENAIIGEPQSASFTVTANALLCSPKISFTITDIEPATTALTGDPSVVVCHASTVQCTLTAEAQNGATIVKKIIAGQEVEGDVLTIAAFAENSVSGSVTDSRGYTTEFFHGINSVPYTPLTANVTAGRTDPTSGKALVSVKGNYFEGSFGVRENALVITCQVGEQKFTMVPTIAEGKYQAELELEGLDYLQSHTVSIIASDKLTVLTRSAVVGKGVPVFDWGEKDFRFNVPVTVPAPTADEHAVSKAWAVARTGDTMTGALAAPQLIVRADGYPGMYICRGDGSVLGTLSASDYHGCIYLTNNSPVAYEAFFTPQMTPGRTDGAIYYLLTTKEAVTVNQGGTGASDAAAARSNLGICCTSLMSRALETVGTEQVLAAGYKGYLVMGYLRSGSGIVSSFIPAAALTENAVKYQLADNTDSCTFEMWHIGGVPVIRRSTGTGAVTAVFGIN